MLKTSHQITVADGTKEDRRETRLSVQHWLTSPSTGIGFNSKSQMPPTHIRGQGALPFSVKLISNLLHPSLSVSYSPTIPTPLLSGRWFVSFTERKNKINFLQPLTKTHTSLLISAFLCPLLCQSQGGAGLPSCQSPICFHILGKLHYQLSFFLHLQCFNSKHPFLLTTLSYLNGISLPHNTSWKQLSLFSNHVAQKQWALSLHPIWLLGSMGHCQAFFLSWNTPFDTPRWLLAVSSWPAFQV